MAISLHSWPGARLLGGRCRRARAAAALTLAVALTGACAEVDLDTYLHPTASPTPTAAPVPTGMVMPTLLPSVQPTAARQVSVSFPDLPGYTVDSQADDDAASLVPSATQEAGAQVVAARTWSSQRTRCSVQAVAVGAPGLAVAGGDDRHLSEAWAQTMEDTWRQYEQTSRKVLTIGPQREDVKAIGTAFVARVAGSDVTGMSLVRVWSADGVALELTETCQRGAFDQEAWTVLHQQVAVSGLSGADAWPAEASQPEASARPEATPQTDATAGPEGPHAGATASGPAS